jgi:hypothetical protein
MAAYLYLTAAVATISVANTTETSHDELVMEEKSAPARSLRLEALPLAVVYQEDGQLRTYVLFV